MWAQGTHLGFVLAGQTIRAPILILHAHNDPVIPLSHSRTLTDQLLSPLLPPSACMDQDGGAAAILEDAGAHREKLVREYQAGGWGVVSRFDRTEGFGPVIWAEVSASCHVLPRA